MAKKGARKSGSSNHHASPTHKNRKYGRNKAKCAKYRAEGRREKNKAKRIAKCNKKQ